MVKSVLLLFVFIRLINCQSANGQALEIEYYNAFSIDLLTDIEQFKRERIKEITKLERGIVDRDYRRRADYLQHVVNKEVFIKYDTMEQYLLHLFDRLEAANSTGE